MIKQNTMVLCLSPSKGGMELSSVRLAQLLADSVNISLVVKKNSYLASICTHKKNNYDFETVDFLARTAIKFISFSLIKQIRFLIKKKQIKNVIFLGTSELKSLYFAFKGFDINLIIRYGTAIGKPKNSWLHRLIYKSVNTHVANSMWMLCNTKKMIPITNNLTMIYPHYQMVNFDTAPMVRRKIEIIHIARTLTSRGKGCEIAVKACQILADNNIDFCLTLVGEIVSESSEIVKWIKQLSYRDKVKTLGYVSDINTKLNNYDVMLFPSRGEGFGNVFVEGLANGLVTIAFDNSAISEIVKLGFHSHLARDGDILDIEQKLLFACQNIKTEKQKSHGNIKKVAALFSPEKERDAYLALLR